MRRDLAYGLGYGLLGSALAIAAGVWAMVCSAERVMLGCVEDNDSRLSAE